VLDKKLIYKVLWDASADTFTGGISPITFNVTGGGGSPALSNAENQVLKTNGFDPSTLFN